MKVSLNLIKKYINLEGLDINAIVNRLTFAGVEVESVEQLASATNLTVGKVLTCENMPDSDHLHLTTIDAGSHGILHIVCGAPNVRKDLKVIVALDGAVLPGGTIKKGKIRGHDSEGMLCSLLELGVESKYLNEYQQAGIEELPEDAVPGDDNVLGLLGLDDVILDLKLLANRSDLYSAVNVAKEIQTLFEIQADIPTYKDLANAKLDVTVGSATPRCSQFSGRVVKGIKVKESPKWMKETLRAEGIRSINNIVDIGNYVMLVTGQPLHMYDLDKLPKLELIARDDLELDFVALDEKTYKVQPGDVVITSDGRPMCLGGVMGSLECAVDENTKNIIVEAANFDFASIRRTSIRLNLVSDSSQRFVKGINPNQYIEVQNLTAELLKELCEAEEIGEIHNYLEKEYQPTIVRSSVNYINGRLGTEFTKAQIINALERAFIKVTEEGDELVCLIPDSRIDITGEADLSEEVIRILGFENVKVSLPLVEVTVGACEELLQKKRIVRSFLRGQGLDEQIAYSLVRGTEVETFNDLNKEAAYRILNPLTDEHEYVRTNVLPSLINQLVYNVNRNQEDVAFFEVSDLYSEGKRHIHLGVVLSGGDLRRGRLVAEEYNFFHMKGIVEGLLHLFGIDEKRYTFERSAMKELHPGKSANLKVDGKVIASFGELHPVTAKKLGVDGAVVLEMNLDGLFAVRTGLKKMEQTSKYPAVKRDFAMTLKDDVLTGDVINEIKKVNRSLIRNVEIFDVYRGEHIKEGYYSLALSVTISSMEKTLTDGEILALQESIINALSLKFGAELRK